MASTTAAAWRRGLYAWRHVVDQHRAANLPCLGVSAISGHHPTWSFPSFDGSRSAIDALRAGSPDGDDSRLSLLPQYTQTLAQQLAFLTPAVAQDPYAAHVLTQLTGTQRHLATWHQRLGLLPRTTYPSTVRGRSTGGRTNGGVLAFSSDLGATAAVATSLETGLDVVGRALVEREADEEGRVDLARSTAQRAHDRGVFLETMESLTQRAFRPPAGPTPGAERQRALALVHELFLSSSSDSAGREKNVKGDSSTSRAVLRYAPTEYLYDGFSRFLMEPALAGGAGSCFALAAITTCLAARVAVPCVPLTARTVATSSPRLLGVISTDDAMRRVHGHHKEDNTGGAFASSSSSSSLSSAARYGSLRAGMVEERWVVRLGGGGSEAVYVDLSRPEKGQVGREEAAIALFGSVLAAELDAHHRVKAQTHEGTQGAAAPYEPYGWLDQAQVSGPGMWSYVVAEVVRGFQRRGMSDLVASWLLVKMACDPTAEEWGVLAPFR
jgi:hypothetical protein